MYFFQVLLWKIVVAFKKRSMEQTEKVQGSTTRKAFYVLKTFEFLPGKFMIREILVSIFV